MYFRQDDKSAQSDGHDDDDEVEPMSEEDGLSEDDEVEVKQEAKTDLKKKLPVTGADVLEGRCFQLNI